MVTPEEKKALYYYSLMARTQGAGRGGRMLNYEVEEDEWNEGIIPNAILNDIYKGQGFLYKLDELDKSKNYYVYCKAGGRSAQACAIMNQMGFETTFNLEGGFSQWKGNVAFRDEN